MPDHLALRFRHARPTSLPPGLASWNGYAMPDSVRTHRREDLIAIAAANGLALSPELLHKWRYWRLVPAPTPGGATGKGRGKGQTWPHGAAWRVAWISRWVADSLTYDAIRLAIWPWTTELELERVAIIRDSLGRFVAQDRAFHGLVWEGGLDPVTTDVLDPYLSLMEGDHRALMIASSLDIAGIGPDDPSRARHAALFRNLGFEELLATAATITPEELAAFIAEWRAATADRATVVEAIFWDSPLSLARILVRGLHRFRLAREGAI